MAPEPSTDLARFHAAQAGVHAGALAELRAGRKVGHWMWFEFPQLAALGRSETSRFYGIRDLDEARAYLADPTLRANLVEIAGALLGQRRRSAAAILGSVDALKLRSSMTLFERAAAGTEPVFAAVLDAFFAAQRDDATLGLLDDGAP